MTTGEYKPSLLPNLKGRFSIKAKSAQYERTGLFPVCSAIVTKHGSFLGMSLKDHKK